MDNFQEIWNILKEAILKRKAEGSKQWQNGYPNELTVLQDIKYKIGYVLLSQNQKIGYAAILKNGEPEYNNIKGKWLSNGDYLVLHRVAIAKQFLGLGKAKILLILSEKIALQQNISSIKIDTNFDNKPMLHILQQLNYKYCGEVMMNNEPRMAFEKLL